MGIKGKDNRYFGRGKDPMDLEIIKAEGSFLHGSDGKKYIDFLGGAGVGNLGWANKEIEEAIKNSQRPPYVYPNLYYEPWIELAELLAKITPDHLVRSFRATGGSEAVEAAMQIAMMYTGRKKFLSLEGSYHGNTIGTLSLGSSFNQEKFPNLLSGCEKIKPPLNKTALQEIKEHLQDKEIAAFIMEPIVCNLGVLVPENGFMEDLEKMCRETGTLLVMDEAITGFGRTGKLFATEHFKIKPDIMCLAKAMSAGYVGIGAVITTDEIAKAVEGDVGLYSSYGWHPVSVDATIANIYYWEKNKEYLFTNVEEVGVIFKERISEIRFKNESEIKIKGLAIAVDVKDKEYASAIKKKCLKAGLLINSSGTNLTFYPALNIDSEVVKEGIRIFAACV